MHRQQGVWEQVQQSVPRKSSHCHGDQELEKVLVEHFLHYWYDQHTQYAAQRDQEDGGCGRQPGFQTTRPTVSLWGAHINIEKWI